MTGAFPGPPTPSATALVCTRNRGPAVVTAVRSLLGNSHPNFELIVIDQSTNEETVEAVRPFLDDPRLRYVRTTTQGLGTARNIGLELARSNLVVMTDDDCEVEIDWIKKMVAVLAEYPRVALVYCNVAPAPVDATLGFVPGYVATESRLLTTMRDWCSPHGIGAGMAVRRDLMDDIGGCDESLGPGARFASFDDSDIALRALLMGYQVYHTHKATVIHFGFRTWREGRALTQRDCIGIGAGYAKLLKCRQWRAALPWAYEWFTLVLVPIVSSLIRLKKPPVLVRGVSLLQGFWRGLHAPVDRRHLLFRSEN